MNTNVYARRRKRLLAMLGEGGVAVLPAEVERVRNRDVHYPFRQDSDFAYLTGYPEPDALMVLAPGSKHGDYLLFVRPNDPEMEVWNGRRAGLKGAEKDYGADKAFPIDEVDELLPALLADRERVFYPMGRDGELDAHLLEWLNVVRQQARAGITAPREFVDIQYVLHEMRLFKDEVEVEQLRAAAKVTAKAHRRAMRKCEPGMVEYELEADLLHDFRRKGGEPAYPCIVAGGANACILHYTDNSAELKEGDLVLIDAGAELHGYAADITRTFPVSGRFTRAQGELYEVVLEAQEAALAAVRPGNRFDDPHRAAVEVITRGLVDLGLLEGKPQKLIEEEAYRPFFMHRTGHWLGRDVHDVGEYKIDGRWRELEPGMVLTIEPGLYIPDDKALPKRYRGIGIRIEDDVLVTREGHENLTAAVPKTVAEIEACMQKG